jgi:CBS domain containing-hemolysin-like protein
MVIVEPDMTVTAALDRAIEHGISRMPVIGDGDHDDAVGLVYTKDLMRAEREGRGDDLATSVGRPVVIIPENKPVARLMREMQAQKFHLAIVADEYGNIVGLVTLEDCLEELVGEIVDEFDEETAEVVELPDGTYRVAGRANVSDLNERLGVDLPDEEWDTVGGFVFGTLEHVPDPGEEVDFNGWRFIVEQVEGRRIRSVLVHRETEPA